MVACAVTYVQVVLLSSKMGSQGAQDIPPGGGLVNTGGSSTIRQAEHYVSFAA